MPILLKTQIERTAKAPIPACHARVGGLCGFRDTVERPRRKPENRTLRRRAGALAKNARIGKNGSGKSHLRQMQENAENGQNRGILDAAARKQDKAAGSCAHLGKHNCPQCGRFGALTQGLLRGQKQPHWGRKRK